MVVWSGRPGVVGLEVKFFILFEVVGWSEIDDQVDVRVLPEKVKVRIARVKEEQRNGRDEKQKKAR